jgi:hypothetical protein
VPHANPPQAPSFRRPGLFFWPSHHRHIQGQHPDPPLLIGGPWLATTHPHGAHDRHHSYQETERLAAGASH